MKKKIGLALKIAAAALVCASFSVCDTNTDDDAWTWVAGSPPQFVGDWRDYYNGANYDGYKITGDNTFEYGGSHGVDYTGDISGAAMYPGGNGVIIFKYTSSNYSPSSVGKYNAIYYKDSSLKKLPMGTAANPDWSDPVVDTLGEARAKFTIDEAGTYATRYGPYIKQ